MASHISSRIHVTILLAICLGLSVTTAEAFDTLDGDRTKWSNNPDFSIGQLSPNIANQLQLAAIRAGFSVWAQVRGSSLAFNEIANNGDITVDFLQRWPAEFGRYAAGITETSRRGGRIVRANISLNEQNFEWSTTPNVGESDVQGVLTHEVGHAIGLSHSFRRDATMYWTGGEMDLRTLSPDDERGVRFLYGDPEGQGQLCDVCLSHDDCAQGAFCLGLEGNRAFCGAPCAGGCPENTDCFDLQGGQQSCVPRGRGCSDEAPGPFEEGDYCYGTAQCGANMMCIPLIDSARCARTCQPGGAPCPRGECVGGGGGQPGVCMTPGDRGYGEACESNFDCQSLSCIPMDAGENICTIECDPDRNDCPNGRCVRTRGDDNDGICLPPGDVSEGELCGFLSDRCAAGMACISESRQSVCRRMCDPFGDCPPGQGCSPTNDDTWACYATGPTALGEACDRPQCGGGRMCAPTGPRESGLCAELCDPGNPNHCGQAQCIDFGGEYGVCPQGAGQFGTPCESANECLLGACVWTPDGTQCSSGCSGNADCPMNWSCREYGNGRMACFRDNAAPAGGGGGSPGSGGSGGGQGGAAGQSSGGAGGAGGAGGTPGGSSGGGGGSSGQVPTPGGGGGGSPGGSMNGGGAPVQADGGAPGVNGGPSQPNAPNRVLVSKPASGGCSVHGERPLNTYLLLLLGGFALYRRRLNGQHRRPSAALKITYGRESDNA